MKIAFVSKMSDKLLEHFIEPIQNIEEVEEIGLFRTVPFNGKKIKWMKIPEALRKNNITAEIYRFFLLLKHARKYDIIIGCFQQPHGILAWLVGKLYGIPVIQSIISEIAWNDGKRLATMAVMKSGACTVMGPICREKLINRGYKKPVEVIHLTNESPEPAPRETPPKFDLLAIGGYEREKDYPWMMEVLSELKKELPNFSMAIRASGDKRNELPDLIKSYGLESNITLLGYLTEEELSEAFLSSKIYLLTSETEGLTTALVEAMMHGLPAIVSKVGNLPWLVRDSLDGRVISHGDTREMAKSIAETLSDEELLAKYKKNVKLRMFELKNVFTVGYISKIWERLFSKLKKAG